MAEIIFSDTHFGTRNNSQFYLEKTKEFYNKVIDFIENNEVSAIFHPGDFLDDRRNLNILVLNEIDSILEKLDKLGIPIYFLLGNHDIYYKHEKTVNGLKPIFKNYKNLKLISKPKYITGYSNNYFLVPWIVNSDIDSIKRSFEKLSDDVIIIGHFAFSELMQLKGSNSDPIPYTDFKRFKKVYSGHYHINTSKDNITYVGSILDYKWGEETSPHGFYYIQNDKEQFIENKDNIHKKIIVNTLDELKNIINISKGKEIKLIFSNELNITNREYDFYINQIDKISESLIVLLSNDLFDNEPSNIINNFKSFTEYINEFFKDKKYIGISNEVLIKIITNLYNISLKEEI